MLSERELRSVIAHELGHYAGGDTRLGPWIQIAALRRIRAYGAAFDGYWMNEVVPVLNAKRRPPIAEGFSRFIADDGIERQANEILERELAEGTTSPYDSHPSLPERIAAVQELPAAAWRERALALGIADLPLAAEVPAAA
jgi:Zn-dependent protease with chaperone function